MSAYCSSAPFYVSYKLLFELPPWLLVQHLWKTVFSRDSSYRPFHLVEQQKKVLYTVNARMKTILYFVFLLEFRLIRFGFLVCYL